MYGLLPYTGVNLTAFVYGAIALIVGGITLMAKAKKKDTARPRGRKDT